MKEKMVGVMQTFSKAIVAPVLYLPAIGIILVICNFMTFRHIRTIPLLSLCRNIYYVTTLLPRR